MKAALATAKQRAGESSSSTSVAADREPSAGAGGAGAGGGMPDMAGLASMLGGMGGGGGGGMPDLAGMMRNPQMMQMYVPPRKPTAFRPTRDSEAWLTHGIGHSR